ncbi:MAG: LCP family protein [Synergistetes bacterium]|nr:LCP family protein [Synergistota bacterium]
MDKMLLDYSQQKRLYEKRRRRKKILLVIAVVILAALVGGGIKLYKTVFPSEEEVAESIQKVNGRVYILLFGVDSVEGSHRSDTIGVVSIDLGKKDIGVLSIPRDTRVRVPGRGWTKINHSYAYGGEKLLARTVSDFIGIPVNYYIKINYKGFMNIVDMIGGVKIKVEKNMHYVDKAGHLYINIPKGEHVLTGKEALGYVRFRHDVLGDIGRIKRQQKFAMAMLNKIRSMNMLTKLPSLVPKILKAIDTNLSYQQIIYLAKYLKDVDFSKIRIATVPGKPIVLDGVSYWEADLKELQPMIDSVLLGKRPLHKKAVQKKEYKPADISVEVLNGCGAPGIAAKFGNMLKDKGFKVVAVGNAKHFNYPRTLIVDHQSIKERAELVKKSLGFGKVLLKKEEVFVAPVTVIVGKDYKRR